MMWRLFFWTSLALACTSLSTFAQERIAESKRTSPTQPSDRDLEWAEGVALDFLNAAAEGDVAQAEALMGASLKEALRKTVVAARRPGKPTIESRTLSPSGSEALFRGSFAGERQSVPFTVRVARDDSEAWRVSFFRLQSTSEVTRATEGADPRQVESARSAARRAYRRYAEQLLQRYDEDKSGQLEREEWSKMPGVLQPADKDGAGIVTIEDLVDHMETRQNQKRVQDAPGLRKPESDRSATSERYLRYAEGLLRQYDENRNGRLEQDEWGKMRGEPEQADKNGDGIITVDELAEFIERSR